MSIPINTDNSVQLSYSSFPFTVADIDNYATSNFVSNVSNALRTAINTKQDTLTAATTLLGVGTSITAIDYTKVSVNKPTNFQADWNSTIINKPTIYTQSQIDTFLNAKQNNLTAATTLLGTGGSITGINYNTVINKPSYSLPLNSNATTNTISISLSDYYNQTQVNTAIGNTSNYSLNISNILKTNIDGNNTTINTAISNTSNYALNISNILTARDATKQNTLTAGTTLLGTGGSITGINYNTVINKPSYSLPLNSNATTNTISISLSDYYNQTQVNGLITNTSNYASNISNVLKANIDTKDAILSFTSPLTRTINTITFSESSITTLTNFYNKTEANSLLSAKDAILSFTSPLIRTVNTITFSESAITTLTNFYNKTEANNLLNAKQATLTFSSPLVNTTNTITFSESAITTLTNFYNKTDANARYLQLTGGTMSAGANIITTGNIRAGSLTTGETTYQLLIGPPSATTAAALQTILQGTGFNQNLTLQASGGNVGIGTSTNITDKLVVNGNIKAQILNLTTVASGNNPLYIKSTNTTANNCIQIQNDLNRTAYIGLGGSAYGNNYQNNFFIESANGAIILNTNGRTSASTPNLQIRTDGHIETSGYIIAGTNGTSANGLRIGGFDYSNTFYMDAITIGGAAADIGFTLRNANSFRFNSLTVGTGYISIATLNTNAISLNKQTIVAGNFKVSGIANIHNGSPFAVINNFMATGSLTIGGTTEDYGVATNWSSSTAGLMMECNNYTEICIHDSGSRLASPMYYDGLNNTINIGRDKGWGASSTNCRGTFSCTMLSVANSGTDYVGVQVNSSQGTFYNTPLAIMFGSFTGFHRCFTDDELFDLNNPQDFKDNYLGRIVISSGKIATDTRKVDDEEWSIKYDKEGITIEDALPIFQLARKKKDKRVLGVLGMSSRNNSRTDRLIVNSVGEGGIWICNSNGNIENGDYITSSDYLGYGEKQDDDLLHNYTVAKATMDCDFQLDNPLYNCIEIQEGLRIAFIAATYHCG